MRFGITAFILTLALPLTALAQLGTVGSGGSQWFTVSVNPQDPAPYGTATLSFLSDTLDLNNATLSVSVAGKKIYQGSVHSVAVTLGKGGSVTNVSVSISSGGATHSQSLSIVPQEVTLVAEPVSFAPPLYPGKSLVPLEGTVRVVAVANLRTGAGKTIDPSAVSYTWTVDGVQIANSSGIGKDTIMVASPLQYRTREVSVSVMSQDGSQVGGASLSLSPEQPSVKIYENDPLLGIRYDHALSNSYSIAGAESTLYAAPFSVSTTGANPLVQWFLNGSLAQTGNSITLRPTGTGQGSASLSVVASGGQSTTATAGLSLIFGATSGSNFFGL